MTQRNMTPTRIGMDFQREGRSTTIFGAIHILIEEVVHEIQEQGPCQTSKNQGDQTIASTTRCDQVHKGANRSKYTKDKEEGIQNHERGSIV